MEQANWPNNERGKKGKIKGEGKIIPLPLDSRLRQSFERILNQVYSDAVNVRLEVCIPVNQLYVKNEVVAILRPEFLQHRPNPVVGEFPLPGGEVVEHFHEFVNLLVYSEQSGKSWKMVLLGKLWYWVGFFILNSWYVLTTLFCGQALIKTF